VPHRPARTLNPQAQIGLLALEEQALVHNTGTQERLAAGQHERTDRPVALGLAVVKVKV
jgi:hypothetical protein